MRTDLSDSQNEELRKLFIEARDKRFKGRVTDLAKTLRRAQPSISDFINGRTGISFETARRFAVDVDARAKTIIGIQAQTPAGLPVEASASARERGALMARAQLLPDEEIELAMAQLTGAEYDDLDAEGIYQVIKEKARLHVREMSAQSPLGKTKRKSRPKKREEQIEAAAPAKRRRATG